MISGSVYGQTGPLAQQWGVDGTGAALSGRTFLTGWPDRDPVVPGSVPYGDVIVPYVMAALAAAAVQQRRETGRGAHIDASMYEICVQQTWPAVRAARDGVAPSRSGNEDPAAYRQGVYPAAGRDRWVAISVDDAAEWDRLTRHVGTSELVAWTSTRADHAIVEELQRAGFAAGVVQDIEDLVENDPTLAARGALIPLQHAKLGEFGHVRTPLSLSRDRVEPFRPPSLGEHGETIARELAGLSAERIAALRDLGVFR
jgi:crotonobetainyl-CoA:carnitine CoA-transferase CaiB-like acyl-CoA transferase